MRSSVATQRTRKNDAPVSCASTDVKDLLGSVRREGEDLLDGTNVVLLAEDHVHHLMKVFLPLAAGVWSRRGVEEHKKNLQRTLFSSSSTGSWYNGCIVLSHRPCDSLNSVSAMSSVTEYV